MTKNYPPPIYSTEPGSWAHLTVKERLPAIAQRVIKENKFPAEINDRLNQLCADIPDQSIRQLKDKDAPDQKAWEGYIKPYVGKNWLVVPWFFAEHYFYRRIMEAVDYFNNLQDPFGYSKEQGLITTQEDINSLTTFLSERLKNSGKIYNTISDGLYSSLWGNQADLSLWPAGLAGNPKQPAQKSFQDHLLANDIKQVLKLLINKNPVSDRVDIMLDNAGFELVSDLALADLLISNNLVEQIILHVKAHPTFVSDVIEKDLEKTINYLTDSSEKSSKELGIRLNTYFMEGKIQAKAHFFWNSPLPMWKLPQDLQDDLKESRLLIIKGDANYRRILGDRQWDFTVPFHQAVDYLPVPLAALRTLKAELAVGLELEQIQDVFNQDSNWLLDGKWGVIHYAKGFSNQ